MKDDYISRQAAISAICNACGKIDCDKMDKCEKLQLPPANCSEFPNNSDMISRQAAIEAIGKKSDEIYKTKQKGATYPHDDFFQGMAYAENVVEQMPSAQADSKELSFTRNALDTISRQAAIEAVSRGCLEFRGIFAECEKNLNELPPAQTEIIVCADCKHWICHDRRCGYWNHGVKPLEWCCHAEGQEG